jgi:hypothetical protein
MVKNAKKAELDFIIFTDHNSVGMKRDHRDKNYDALQVIAGTEITPECKFIRFEDKDATEDKVSGHLLVIDLDELPSDELIMKGISQEMIDYVEERGLLCFVAHPDHKGTKTFGVPSYRCRNFDVTGYIGFSLWDLQTDWQNYVTSTMSGLFGYFFPSLALKGPEPETIERWDALTKERSYSIIGEIDQHAYKYKLFGLTFTIFKSKYSFKTIRTHVVLHQSVDMSEDYKKQVLDGLKAGHTYVSLDSFNDATGFIFEARVREKKFLMGDTIKNVEGSIDFNIRVPLEADIRVIKDGEQIIQQTGDEFSFIAKQKGTYRVEVYKKAFFKLRPWIFSNTIRIV